MRVVLVADAELKDDAVKSEADLCVEVELDHAAGLRVLRLVVRVVLHESLAEYKDGHWDDQSEHQVDGECVQLRATLRYFRSCHTHEPVEETT